MATHRPLKVTYDVHDACSIAPRATEAEREELKRDIADNGVQIPLVIWNDENGTPWIVDGRHRFEICKELNIDFPTREFKGTEVEMVAFVVGANLRRRHLTESQRAAVKAKAEKLSKSYQDRAGKSGRPVGVKNDTTAEASLATSAKEAGVSRRTMAQARKVAKESPEKLDEIIEGKTSVSAAAKEVAAEKNGAKMHYISPSDEGGEEEPASPADRAAERMAQWNKDIEAWARSVTGTDASAPTGIDDSTMGIIRGQLKAAAGTIRQQKGEGLCPYCRAEGCDRCNHRGFLNKTSLAAVPPNVRDAAEIEWAKAA